MMNVAKALYSFYSSFGIPAYEENSVPDNAKLPYITYELVAPNWRDTNSISATVWYSGTSLAGVGQKVDEISNAIGDAGIRVPIDGGGCLWIYKGTPFSQAIATEKDNIKGVYLLLEMHALTN